MASATNHDTPHPAPMHPVPAPLPAAAPMLIPDLDPVLLLRLYPDKMDMAGAKAAAMAQGAATAKAGEANVAAQQQPPPPHVAPHDDKKTDKK
jgi:hypothetical protein